MSEWLLIFEAHETGRTTHVPVILSATDEDLARDGACEIARAWWEGSGEEDSLGGWHWPQGSVYLTGIWWYDSACALPDDFQPARRLQVTRSGTLLHLN